MAKQEAAQNTILPKVVVPCAVPAAEPWEAKGAAATAGAEGQPGVPGVMSVLLFPLMNECLLLQAQRPQKVEQTQVCEPVPVVPLPSQDRNRNIHLPPSGQ